MKVMPLSLEIDRALSWWINGVQYAKELTRLSQEIGKKGREQLNRGLLLLQDNVPAHTYQDAMAAATKCSFEVLSHPQYSPDLAPSTYFQI